MRISGVSFGYKYKYSQETPKIEYKYSLTRLPLDRTFAAGIETKKCITKII